jgi:hypothetical protein
MPATIRKSHMKNKHILLVAVFIVALVAGSFWFRLPERRQTPTPITNADLTKDEQGMYKLVREIPGDLVVRESLERDPNSTVVVTFFLDQSKTKMQSMAYNLTTLAKRQHDLGISDEEFKASLMKK